jgi:hypothetical protein
VRRVRAIALATKHAGVSPFLPLAAGLLMALFAVSLAMAEPSNELQKGAVVAAHDGLAVSPYSGEAGLATDAATPDDTPILSRPLSPPSYHDRFRFYHRYDHALRARFNPIDGDEH